MSDAAMAPSGSSFYASAIEAVREDRVTRDFHGADVARRDAMRIAVDGVWLSALIVVRTRIGSAVVDRHSAWEMRARESAVVGERTEARIDIELVQGHRIECASCAVADDIAAPTEFA